MEKLMPYGAYIAVARNKQTVNKYTSKYMVYQVAISEEEGKIKGSRRIGVAGESHYHLTSSGQGRSC